MGLAKFQFIEYICALGINAQNDQGCTGIEPALQFSAAGLKQSEITIRSRRRICIRNNNKHINKRFNFVTNGKKIMNEL